MAIIKKCIIFETEQNYSTPTFDLGYLGKYFKNSNLSGDSTPLKYHRNTYLSASVFNKNYSQYCGIGVNKYFTNE
jgi:hypothetical protein